MLREYQLNDLGLIDQVATTNANTGITKDLLAAPMCYRVTANGKTVVCDAQPMQAQQVKGDEADYQGQFKAAGLTANWKDQ